MSLARKSKVVTTVIVTAVSSLVVGLLLAYLTNIIFRPDVVYAVSTSKISLPLDYEKEIAKVRALLVAKRFAALISKQPNKASLSIEPGIENKKLGIKNHELGIFSGKSRKLGDNSLLVEGNNLEKMLNSLDSPDALRAMLDPTISFPTAFATIDIYNSGNREANDLEMNIAPNGVLIEALVKSTEPSAEKWEDIIDTATRLPVGIHLPVIRRLPSGGTIRMKIYWNMLEPIGKSTEGTSPTVDIKGSFSGGMVRFVDATTESRVNWPLWLLLMVAISIGSIALGYWIKGFRRNDSNC